MIAYRHQLHDSMKHEVACQAGGLIAVGAGGEEERVKREGKDTPGERGKTGLSAAVAAGSVTGEGRDGEVAHEVCTSCIIYAVVTIKLTILIRTAINRKKLYKYDRLQVSNINIHLV